MNADDGLQTKRLSLERLAIGDAAFMLAVWNDPAFLRHVGDRGIRSIEDARQALTDGPLRLYAEYGYGPYRLDIRDSGTPIGICGLFRREGLDDPDLGFALLPAYCGRGYAREAAVAVLAHARDDLGLRRLAAIVSPANAASIGLIERLGFDYEKTTRLGDDREPVRLYAMDLHPR